MLADVASRSWIPALTLMIVAMLASCERPPDHPSPTSAAPAPGETARPPSPVIPFADPTALARTLAAAESALADSSTSEDERTRWAHAHQQGYRDLASHPDWRDEVRPNIPAKLRPAFDSTLRATTALRRLTSPRPRPPAGWKIGAPTPLPELRSHYEEAERKSGAPWTVLAAIHLVETRFGRIQGESHAGAQGPMQFMPQSWKAFGNGGDVRDPRDAILAAGRYLAAHGAPADMRRALFAYNRSEDYVDAILAHAEAMRRYDHYLDVYHRWRVHFRTTAGDLVLEEGFHS